VSRSEPGWSGPLRAAYDEPWAVAERWRANGGRVVGLLGASAPRELVLAAGLLPIRLRPRRLGPLPPPPLPAALERELDPETAPVVAELLAARPAWIDALLIGRDSEAHTKLFYVLRELAGDGEHALVPLAFADLLRLPFRTTARYNRRRLRELAEIVGGWGGRSIAAPDLAAAVAELDEVAAGLRRLDRLRIDGRISGRDALVAGAGAQMLAPAQALAALAQMPDDGLPELPGARLFVTGSDIDDPSLYALIEDAGALIVGDDHGWGDDGRGAAVATPDPLAGIADRYQFSVRRSARAGLDRVAATAARVRETGAHAVLQIVLGHDEASGWELPVLRDALPELPIEDVVLAPGEIDAERLLAVVRELLAAVAVSS
jgi:hypothetical protein